MSSSSGSHTYRVMKKKNPIIFWKPIILTYFTFPINTTPIISCHGSIHLPVWSRDQPEVENPSLSGDSYIISDIWWPQYRIASCVLWSECSMLGSGLWRTLLVRLPVPDPLGSGWTECSMLWSSLLLLIYVTCRMKCESLLSCLCFS